MKRLTCTIVTSIAVALSFCPMISRGESPSQKDKAFFETKIRPALVKHCYECHSAEAKEPGGKLLLDTREGLLKGGESGPAVVPGDAEKSLIVQAVKYVGVEMPPEKPLPESVVNDLVKWVTSGAHDPRTPEAMEKSKQANNNKTLWSLKSIQNPPLPQVKQADWPRDPIDRFVLARIEAAGIEPAADADPKTLIRRLYNDLIGLPPTFEEIESFAAAYENDAEMATAAVVDDLLARPQFGERWGRHWLDVARFAESNGNDGLSRNSSFPHAWRYRDYVIGAIDEDTPWNRFLTEQIAGDLLPTDAPDERDRNLTATGFLAMAAKPAKAMNDNFDMDVVADQLDLIGRGVIGLSIGCARCHDHKFDPIPTRDYYALAGIFTSTETMWGLAANEKLTAPPTDLHVLKAAAKRLPPADFVETVILRESDTGKPKAIPKPKWGEGTPLAMGVRDRAKPADCKINIKGAAKSLGEAVPRGFLSACGSTDSPLPEIASGQSGRLQLAQWLTSERHPLTARVMANRIWLHLFGDAIVRTPDDFGEYGQRPTHPLLLDHLATRFIENGWSLKQTIRLIVLSRTYQIASDVSPDAVKADEENRLLARHNRRRLDAESLRDSMLLASGELDLAPGDGSLIEHRDILVNLAGNLHQACNKRSIYLCYLRSSPPPELAAFDLPEFVSPIGKREVSSRPGQALYLYNNPFVVEQSQRFASQVLEADEKTEARIRHAFRQAFQREPTHSQLEQTAAALAQLKKQLESEEKAWSAVCQALLMANEFRYVD